MADFAAFAQNLSGIGSALGDLSRKQLEAEQERKFMLDKAKLQFQSQLNLEKARADIKRKDTEAFLKQFQGQEGQQQPFISGPSGGAIKNPSFQSPTDALIQRAKSAEAAKTLGNEALFNQIRGGSGQPMQQFGQVGIGQRTQPQRSVAGGGGNFLSPAQMAQKQLFERTGNKAILTGGGGISSERTITIEIDGKHIVLPTIIDGVQFSKEEAIEKALKERSFFGIFDTPEEAQTFAEDRNKMLDRASGGPGRVNLSTDEDIKRTIQGQSRVRPKTFERGPFGKLRGKTFERVPSKAERKADVESTAIAKGRIKEKVLQAEKKTQLGLGKLVSRSNLELIAGTAFDLADVYRKGFEEGGLGGILQSKFSGFATGVGDLPGGIKFGGRFPESGSFPGKRQELIIKMMPMLTQQPTKPEGSVRLIQGVLDAIGMTIPDVNTAPAQAKRQLEETLKSFFRFARASELLGLDFDSVFSGRKPEEVSDSEVQGWINSIVKASGRIEIEGAEADALDSLLQTSLSPFDKIIKGDRKRKSGKKVKSGRTSSGIKFTIEE